MSIINVISDRLDILDFEGFSSTPQLRLSPGNFGCPTSRPREYRLTWNKTTHKWTQELSFQKLTQAILAKGTPLLPYTAFATEANPDESLYEDGLPEPGPLLNGCVKYT